MERKPVDARACCTYRFQPENSIAWRSDNRRCRPDESMQSLTRKAGGGKTAGRRDGLYRLLDRPAQSGPRLERSWVPIQGESRKVLLDDRSATGAPRDAW